MVLADAEIHESLGVTSDSLVLWLAARLNASGVLLVKSAALPNADLGRIADLQLDGLVDQVFHLYASGLTCPVWLAQRERDDILPGLLSRGEARALGVL